METVEVVTNHEVKRESRAGVVVFVPIAIRSLCETKPVYGPLGRFRVGLACRGVA
jgi:hypothetical protein